MSCVQRNYFLLQNVLIVALVQVKKFHLGENCNHWCARYNTRASVTERDILFVRFLGDVTLIKLVYLNVFVYMSDVAIKPLGDRVVVRPLTDAEAGTVSASGIIIPDSAKKEKPEQGVVIAVGAGKWDEDGKHRIAMDVKVGDRVVFSKYGFDEVKVNDTEYFVVSESNILAILG